MIKEEFIKGISTYKKGFEWMDKLADDFNIDLFESALSESADAIFDLWLGSILNNNGVEVVYWWIFEDVEKVIYGDNDEVIATLDTEEDLFNYLDKYEYFK